MRKPRLLLCDEPTGNLDQQTADSVADLIWGEIQREGVAALIVVMGTAAEQILNGARDAGEAGTDAIYGRGILDLGRVFPAA